MVKTITVLLATYNGEKYLSRQLASLQAQDDPSFQVLIQDDGSTDGTPDILSDIIARDSRFRMAKECGRHFGAKGNFMSLLSQLDSDYAALCDQDDEWAPNRLSRCRAAMEAAEVRLGADTPLLVHSDATVVDQHGEVIHESFFRHQGWDPAAVTLPRLLVQTNVTGCTTLLNAALARLAASKGDPAQMHMHDWFIALTAAAFGEVIFLNEPLIRYRQHGVNVMGASKATLTQRGLKALSAWQKGKARITLTYRHTRAFREAYDGLLPPAVQETLDRYLATETMSKLHRVAAVQAGGYTMQSKITRIGQIIFG